MDGELSCLKSVGAEKLSLIGQVRFLNFLMSTEFEIECEDSEGAWLFEMVAVLLVFK